MSRLIVAVLSLVLLLCANVPAIAQDLEARVKQLECLVRDLTDRITKIEALFESESVSTSARVTELSGSAKSYVYNVEIRNLRVAAALLSDRGVFGEVKNIGDRTLGVVEIVIYFLNAAGKPIYESSYRPVNVHVLFDMDDISEPLKPKYARKFGYSTDSVPQEWAGKIQAKVMRVEFYAGDQ